MEQSYKEKYEHALMVAKETYDKQPMYREWFEKMFPELSESEDERIRKVLVDFFRDWRENRSHCWGIAVSKILAWLEKQGEKSVKWNENTDGNKPQKNHSVLMKTTHGITEGEWKGDESWIQYRWSSSLKDSDVLFWIELSDIEKQGEQKPTDEEMKTLLRIEYEKGRADAIAEIQKEWSEEEEVKINRIVACLENLNVADNDILLKDVDWLKSLRPQNRWKPSDEQMKLLSEVQNALLGKDCHNRFTDFMWELKKLKEEQV